MVININKQPQTVHFLPFELYGELIKTKQTALLIYTALFTYLLTIYPNNLNLQLMIPLLICLFFAISGSTMLNMYIDRDIDSVMERTLKRALPNGKTTPTTVLVHGIAFVVIGIVPLYYFVNMITAIVVLLGFFFDVFVYSIWLKRRSRFSILFGGVAGGLPAVAGRTAILGTVDMIAILLMCFILLWIPLHILTLAMMPENTESYRKAGIPMLPVVSGKRVTTLVITIAVLFASILLFVIAYLMNLSLVSIIPLIPLSGYTISLSLSNLLRQTDNKTYKLFKFGTILIATSFTWLYIAKIISYSL